MLMLEKKEKLAVNFPVNFVSKQCPHMGMALVWVLAAPFQAIEMISPLLVIENISR